MKKVSTLLALLFAVSLSLSAKEPTTVTVKLPTMQCGGCKKRIESKISETAGVSSIAVNVDEKTAEVTFDEEVITLAAVEQAISEIGYDANETAANEKAQKSLPACCQPGGHEEH